MRVSPPSQPCNSDRDDPKVAPGNAMTYFEGDAARREKIIAYLRTLH